MAAPHSTSFSPRTFPQPNSWPDSISADQAAIEQARRELGPKADAQDVLARAQEIKSEKPAGGAE